MTLLTKDKEHTSSNKVVRNMPSFVVYGIFVLMVGSVVLAVLFKMSAVS